MSILSPSFALIDLGFKLFIHSIILCCLFTHYYHFLSIFYFITILFAVSTTCLMSSIGNSTQYNFVCSVFLNTSEICGSPYPKSVLCMLCMHLMFLCFHQSEMITMHEITFIGLGDSYHSLASPTSVKQNLWTFTPS